MGLSRSELDAKVVEMQQRSASCMNEAFDSWLDMPLTRLATAMVPPSKDSPEVLKLLLKSAFDSGFKAGGSSMLNEVIATLAGSINKRDGK
jgi:hypothetical protein